MKGETFSIRSDKDTHFTGALLQNNQEVAALSLPAEIDINAISEFSIEGITIQSKQNLLWQVMIWGAVGADDADLDLDTFKDSVSFPSSSGESIGNGAGSQFYYPSADLDIPYKFASPNDLKLYVGLVNRSLTAKLAGVTGEVVIEIKCRT